MGVEARCCSEGGANERRSDTRRSSGSISAHSSATDACLSLGSADVARNRTACSCSTTSGLLDSSGARAPRVFARLGRGPLSSRVTMISGFSPSPYGKARAPVSISNRIAANENTSVRTPTRRLPCSNCSGGAYPRLAPASAVVRPKLMSTTFTRPKSVTLATSVPPSFASSTLDGLRSR